MQQTFFVSPIPFPGVKRVADWQAIAAAIAWHPDSPQDAAARCAHVAPAGRDPLELVAAFREAQRRFGDCIDFAAHPRGGYVYVGTTGRGQSMPWRMGLTKASTKSSATPIIRHAYLV